MTPFQIQVKNALDEARMFALGTQVLLGFQYRLFFESGFEKMPELARQLALSSLGLLLIVIVLLLLPAARHWIVEGGEDSHQFHSFTLSVTQWALLPFATALALDFYITADPILGGPAAIGLAAAALTLCMALWFGIAVFRSPEHRRDHHPEKSPMPKTKLEDRIIQVLTEARVVLPGAQALLGFQFAMVLTDAFQKLPQSSKVLHLISLCCIGAAIVFLMAPAAYHRIVEHGEDSERFHTFASWSVIAAMAVLPLGFAGDLAVVVRLMSDSATLEAAVGIATVALFYAVWFAAMAMLRSWRRRRAATAS